MEDIVNYGFEGGETSMPGLGLSIGDNFLQIIFFLSLIFTLIFSFILFVHWKKYSPNPIKTFGFILTYSIGVIAIILVQITLLSLY